VKILIKIIISYFGFIPTLVESLVWIVLLQNARSCASICISARFCFRQSTHLLFVIFLSSFIL